MRDAETEGRIVARGEHHVALCPRAPKLPYETWLLPIEHDTDFLAAGHDEDLARTVEKQSFWVIPNDYKAVSSALASGAPVMTHASRSKVSRNLEKLAETKTYHQALTLARVLIATEGDDALRRAVLFDNAARLLALEAADT